ncbi:MAG: DUF4177 domain-containing protein [Clostridia bacterium]|nr:DUF4177 domain-containing protein [Clostridia bacterium]
MKYEYKVFTLCLDSSNEQNDIGMQKILNEFGSYGWELVTIDHTSSSYYYKVFLKRVIMEGKTL